MTDPKRRRAGTRSRSRVQSTLRLAGVLLGLGLFFAAMHPAVERWSDHWYESLAPLDRETLDECAEDEDCVSPPSPEWVEMVVSMGRVLLLVSGAMVLLTLPRARRLDRVTAALPD